MTHFDAQVEGTCSGKHGFIICVTGMGNVGKGSIREGLGTALFKVQYSCVVLRPFKGEVIDCVVSSVSKVRGCTDLKPAGGDHTSLHCSAMLASVQLQRGPWCCFDISSLCKLVCRQQLELASAGGLLCRCRATAAVHLKPPYSRGL